MSDLIKRKDALCFNASQSIKIDDTLYVPYIDWYSYLSNLPSAQPDKDLIHLQKEQAYMQGYEDGRKMIRCKDCMYSLMED